MIAARITKAKITYPAIAPAEGPELILLDPLLVELDELVEPPVFEGLEGVDGVEGPEGLEGVDGVVSPPLDDEEVPKLILTILVIGELPEFHQLPMDTTTLPVTVPLFELTTKLFVLVTLVY